MDVQDRSTRLDALTAIAPLVPIGAAGNSEPQPATTRTFAETLQRTPTKSLPAAESQVPAAPSDADLVVSSGVSASPAETAVSLTDENILVIDQPGSDDINLDPGLQSLVAGLMAATSIPTTPVPTGALVEAAVAPPPAALVPALTPATTGLTDAVPAANVAFDQPSPAMPIGLKCCLTPPQVAAAPSVSETNRAATSTDTPLSANDPGFASPAQPASAIAPPPAPQVQTQQKLPTGPRLESALPANVATIVAPLIAATTHPAETLSSQRDELTTGAPSAAIPSDGEGAKKSTSNASNSRPALERSWTDPLGEAGAVSAVVATSVAAAPVPADPVRPVRASTNPPQSALTRNDRLTGEDASLLASWNAAANDSGPTTAGVVAVQNDLRPETGSPSAIPSVVDQLHPALERAVSHERQLTITLRPPELGAVQIEITRHEGRLTARLQTETASAHQLLTDQLPQLREILTPLGVAAEQVQIQRWESPPQNSAGFDGSANGQADAQTAGGRQDDQPQRGPEPRLADEPERDEPARPNIRTRTALNLRI